MNEMSEKLYRMFFEAAGDAIFILDGEGGKAGTIVLANRAAAEMHGYTLDELLTMKITDIDTPDAAREAPDRIRQILKGEWLKAEITHQKKDGTVFPVEVSAGLLELGKRKYILAIDRDITERKRSEEALKESEERYRSLVDSTEDSIYVVDRDYRYLFMNKKHLTRLNVVKDSYYGRAYSDFHSREASEEFIEKVNTVFSHGESNQYEHKSHRDNRYFLRTLSPVKDSLGKTMAVTVISKDITERKQMEEELRSLSLTDDLTGLYNRRGLITLAEQQLKMANRLKRGIFMLYADLDDLKVINDTFGHKTGDQALIDTAHILKTTYRESDIIARIGGDEFIVIPLGTLGDDIDVVTARLKKGIEEHNYQGNRDYTLSISFGVSYYDPEHPCAIDGLLVSADRLMYEQKLLKKAR